MSESKDNVLSKLIVQSLLNVQSLEGMITNEKISDHRVSPEHMMSKLNELSASLMKLIESGNEMNELSLREVPLKLFDYIDVLNSNKEEGERKSCRHYEMEVFSAVEREGSELADRTLFLKDLYANLKDF